MSELRLTAKDADWTRAYMGDLRDYVIKNEDPKKLLRDTGDMQVYAIRLGPGEWSEGEVHEGFSQFLYVMKGTAKLFLGDWAGPATEEGYATIIPPGTDHGFKNQSSSEPAKLLAIYTKRSDSSKGEEEGTNFSSIF